MSGKSKSALLAVVVVFVAVGAYWYYSPILAMRALQSAALAKDADTFNDHVDYPRVRESMKGQMIAMLADKLGTGSNSGAEAFGTALGVAMIGPMVDALVRPEMVMKAMQDGKFKPDIGVSKTSNSSTPSDAGKWEIQRKSVNKVIAYRPDATTPDSRPGFVFERTGFADWKLTEVRLPVQK